MTPFDMLLCERGPEHERDWADGFASAAEWAKEHPDKVMAIYEAVAIAGDWTVAGLPYDAWHEGLVHGIYGEEEYQRWASR